MAANVQPIFSKLGHISWITPVLAANTTTDGTSGTIYTVFTADATNGSRVEKLRIKPLGTNVATVLRVFINNGGATAIASNNSMFDELGLPASSVSQTSTQYNYEIPLGISLPPGYSIFVTLGTAVAAGFAVTAVGGDY